MVEYKENIYNYLIEKGFRVKRVNKKWDMFKKGRVILIFPDNFQERHILTTRKTLDFCGVLSEKEFNKKFNYN